MKRYGVRPSVRPSVCPSMAIRRAGRRYRSIAAAAAGDCGQCHVTIQDAILTCARKPTRVGLIYRTETTTEKCKKTQKVKTDMLRSNSKESGKSCSQP